LRDGHEFWQFIPKERFKEILAMQKKPTAIAVVAAALIDAERRVLMHQRRLGGALGGLWEFPGGKLNPQESAKCGLARELAEELGVTVDPADLTWLAEASEPGNPYVVSLYICRRWQGEPRCLVGEAIAWTPLNKVKDLAMPALDIPLAIALEKAI
jgi:8-oxo-dGTP diphosphatase